MLSHYSKFIKRKRNSLKRF